jgi:hypothetical protein
MNNNPQPSDPHSIVLTRLEIEIALGLFDLAVKQGGLPVATNAVVLSQKLQAAKPLVRIESPSIQDLSNDV